MKFKRYVTLLSDEKGWIPTSRFHWTIRKNSHNTAREEAIAAEVLRQANPRENITSHFPWGPEERMVLQQFWVKPDLNDGEWRDVPIENAEEWYTVVPTEFGDIPVPNAIREPADIPADLQKRVREVLGEDE